MTGLTRRQILAMAAGVALAARAPRARARARARADAPAKAEDFLRISRAVTGRPDLDPILAARMLPLLHEAVPDFGLSLAALGGLLVPSEDPTVLLSRARAAGHADAVLLIVASWYTGTVGRQSHAPMVAYDDALMYRPTADALPVPTYCFGTPGWWTQDPPPLGIDLASASDKRPPAPSPVAVETGQKPTKSIKPKPGPTH